VTLKIERRGAKRDAWKNEPRISATNLSSDQRLRETVESVAQSDFGFCRKEPLDR
jgi:hypothetical protein